MVDQVENTGGTRIWVGLLATASAVTSFLLACATPFAALAAIAATRMSARAGFALMALAWAINRVVGLCMRDYPRDLTAVGWAFAFLTAAFAAFAAARWGAGMVSSNGKLVRTATAFGTGFVAYKATIIGWSVFLGGMHSAASPYWTARQFGREALILAGLLVLYHLLVKAGVPAARRIRTA